MGLDILSQDGEVSLWSGGYAQFMWFRVTLATICHQASFNPYIGDKYTPVVECLLQRLTKLPKWKEQIEEIMRGFIAFFTHSDAEGEWTVEECEQVHTFLTYCKDTLRMHYKMKSKLYMTVFAKQFAIQQSPLSSKTQQKTEFEQGLENMQSKSVPDSCSNSRSQVNFEHTLDKLLEGLQYCIINKQQAKFC